MHCILHHILFTHLSLQPRLLPTVTRNGTFADVARREEEKRRRDGTKEERRKREGKDKEASCKRLSLNKSDRKEKEEGRSARDACKSM